MGKFKSRLEDYERRHTRTSRGTDPATWCLHLLKSAVYESNANLRKACEYLSEAVSRPPIFEEALGTAEMLSLSIWPAFLGSQGGCL